MYLRDEILIKYLELKLKPKTIFKQRSVGFTTLYSDEYIINLYEDYIKDNYGAGVLDQINSKINKLKIFK